MNSRPSNPAYQFSLHSPPNSPNPFGNRPLSTIPATPITPWMESRPPTPPSASSSSKNSLDSLPVPYSSSSSTSSGFSSPKEKGFYADEDEDMFVGGPLKVQPPSWVKKSALSALNGRPRPRTTFVILLLLCAISFYMIFTTSALASNRLIHPPSEGFVADSQDVPTNWSKSAWLKTKVNKKLFKGTRPPLVLTAAEELAALTSFVVALPQNVLPSDVDGSKPLDPQLILDFDIRGGRKAREELQVVRTQVWEENPVVIYAKRFAPQTKVLLDNLINPLSIHPPPAVFFVDERQDSGIITPVLQRVSESASSISTSGAVINDVPVRDGSPFPILLVGGKSVYIPYEEMLDSEKAMDRSSIELKYRTELKSLILQAGGESKPGKKKGRNH